MNASEIVCGQGSQTLEVIPVPSSLGGSMELTTGRGEPSLPEEAKW
jgi:hypothetical protein